MSRMHFAISQGRVIKRGRREWSVMSRMYPRACRVKAGLSHAHAAPHEAHGEVALGHVDAERVEGSEGAFPLVEGQVLRLLAAAAVPAQRLEDMAQRGFRLQPRVVSGSSVARQWFVSGSPETRVVSVASADRVAIHGRKWRGHREQSLVAQRVAAEAEVGSAPCAMPCRQPRRTGSESATRSGCRRRAG